MESIESKILQAIKRKPAGKVVFPEDFNDIGSSEAIRKALQRLSDKNLVVRVAQGIYVRPKINEYIGQVLPSTEELVEGIARRDRARTLPTGSYALNALGLSTQVPMKIVLLTDGSPRVIKIGKRTIKFKKTTPRNLRIKGKISRLAIQALKEIGNGKLDQEVQEKILNLLRKEKPDDLKHDISLAPVWIQKIMRKALV